MQVPFQRRNLFDIDCFVQVQAARRQTREDKKKMALAMRQKQLEALGMVVRSDGCAIFTSHFLSSNFCSCPRLLYLVLRHLFNFVFSVF